MIRLLHCPLWHLPVIPEIRVTPRGIYLVNEDRTVQLRWVKRLNALFARTAIESKNTVIKVHDIYFCYGILYSSPRTLQVRGLLQVY